MTHINLCYKLSYPRSGLARPLGFREIEAPRISRHWQCCQLYAPVAYTPKEKNLVIIYVRGFSQPLGHIAVGNIKSMNNVSDPNGNRTRGLPTCNTITLCYVDRLFFLLSRVLTEPNGCTFKWTSRFILLHFIYSSDENSRGLSAGTA